jgi:hypothetical protein
MGTSLEFFLNSCCLLHGVFSLFDSWKSYQPRGAWRIRPFPPLLVTYTLPNNGRHVKRKKGNGRMWIKEHLDKGKKYIV